MNWAIVDFPGSNCGPDCLYVIEKVLKHKATILWHTQKRIPPVDALILPGGFSYGDYLRSGAIAALSPIMGAVKEAAEIGIPIIGICNGFQILCESRLLPGALITNRSLRFICERIHLRVETTDSLFTSLFYPGEIIQIPIAHGQGCFYADPSTLHKMESEGLILFRYCDQNGNVNEESNPNGSARNIAGVINTKGNVLGLMPHPERASESEYGSVDGKRIFESIFRALEERNGK
ncbi:phosphoribosylformylglycinamidine synthase subunit PurQ [Methylacidiphilum caldifontis]|uniref:phosphoribosylformylglycinamidine synthase subunit PurQ n=1 Tax=Methylacidiphilum caldifontis TaxID=2795386 RepID=UPI001A8E7010|nr:phosphoribosylformylglycinamidine synthase subunit PurQ [Methylacidiphilum caldifontis]QSR87936.1 phosphoribosylformylglycinamidine synthase subunit PurQ [Methylacidiphilum caldifontis]